MADQRVHQNLKRDLIEEAIIVSFVTVAFLFHFRSALVPIITLPIAVLAAFIPMYYLGVSSNVMSLGGIALAIGVLIDAAIVMVENGYKHLAERSGLAAGEQLSEQNRRTILVRAAKQVGPALFYSLIIILVSFLPVFLLEAQEGRMFRPLAWTKTTALLFSSLLSITLVPVLMPMFIRGRLRLESQNPAAWVTQTIYLPVLRWCLRHWKLLVVINLIFLAVTIPLYFKLGSQFMPSLYEGSSLYMPSALPGISITQATALMQEQDRIIRSFPEVLTVFGTVGRSDSATDNAPLDMYDTTIMLQPREQWRPGMTYEKLIGEMDQKLQFPGLTNTWTTPVANRLDMELTGIKTPVGMKIQGPDLEQIQQIGARIQQILSGLDQLFGKGCAPVDQQHRPAKRVEALEIRLAFNCLGRSSLRLRGQSAGNQGGCQKARKGDPILWIGDRERSNRGEEEKIENEGGQHRAQGSFKKAPRAGTSRIRSR